jgi:hypothetical protein
MNGRYGRALTVVATVGSGLMAGAFFGNDDLALVDPNSPGAASAWNDYQTPWMAWNHVRRLAFLAAALLFAVALVKSRRPGATSKTTRPVGELAGAAELSGSGIPR